jgi:hypothetical protein
MRASAYNKAVDTEVIMTIRDARLRLKITSADLFTRTARTAVFIGLIMAGSVPFVLLAFGVREANNLPWYIWAIAALVLVLVVGRGYYMFTLNRRDTEDISISPGIPRRDRREG